MRRQRKRGDGVGDITDVGIEGEIPKLSICDVVVLALRKMGVPIARMAQCGIPVLVGYVETNIVSANVAMRKAIRGELTFEVGMLAAYS